MAIPAQQSLDVSTAAGKAGSNFLPAVRDHIEALWRATALRLTGVGGSASAVTAIATPVPVDLVDSMGFWLEPSVATTVTPTLTIAPFGPRPIQRADGTWPLAVPMQPGRSYLLVVAGETFRLISDEAAATIQAAVEATAAAAQLSAAAAVAARDATLLAAAQAVVAAAQAQASSVGVTRPMATLRLGATRCLSMTAKNTTYRQMRSRSVHEARGTGPSLQGRFSNVYTTSTSVEVGGPTTITVSAALEYPLGTRRQITWSGATSVTIASGAKSPLWDVIPAPPDGARYWVHTHQIGSDGIIFSDVKCMAAGDLCDYAVTGLTDVTMTGEPIDNTASTSFYGPSELIITSALPAVLFLGDSRVAANNSPVHYDVSGNKGNLAQALGPYFAYINGARGGQTMAQLLGSNTDVRERAAYCTHVVIQIGINDITSGASLGTLQSRLNTIIGWFAGKEIWLCTVEPVSTGDWTSVEGQTVVASNPTRVAYNNWIRGGVAGVKGVFDFAAVAESSLDSGKWRVGPGGVALTSDGTHANDAGHIFLNRFMAIDPRRIHTYPEMPLMPATREDLDAGEGANKPLIAGALNLFKAKITLKGADQSAPAGVATAISWDTIDATAPIRMVSNTGRIYLPRGWYTIKGKLRVLGVPVGQQVYVRGVLDDVNFDEAMEVSPSTTGVTVHFNFDVRVTGFASNFRLTVIPYGGAATILANPITTTLYIRGI